MYGYGYGYENYGYGGPSFGIGAAGGIFVTLVVIGFIAAIVLAVVVYRKYASDGNEQPLSFKDKSTWGPFRDRQDPKGALHLLCHLHRVLLPGAGAGEPGRRHRGISHHAYHVRHPLPDYRAARARVL